MSKVIVDPITKERVIYTKKRDNRPSDIWRNYNNKKTVKLPQYSEECPFCVGNEYMTPKVSFEIKDQNSSNWILRVVENKYPILDEGSFSLENSIDIFESFGCHDVLIECPKHNTLYYTMTEKEFFYILKALKERFLDIQKNENIKFISYFKNYQMLAGASLHHPHSQILGMEFIPPRIENEIIGSMNYYKENGMCPYCNLINFDKQNNNIVYENNSFVSLSPYAPKYKYETWILPKTHNPYFHTENNLEDFSNCLKNTFHKMYNAIGDFPMNLYLRYLPYTMKNFEKSYHYHIVIAPRLNGNAGFEVSTGVFVNSVLPSESSKFINLNSNI